MSTLLFSLHLAAEADIVLARQRTRMLAERLGFDGHDQTRLATAVSEIARNAVQYAGGGRITFEIEGRTPPQILTIDVSDQGPGIAHLDEVMSGRYNAAGSAAGIVGARRLVDQLTIESGPRGGTRVLIRKLLPRGARAVAATDVPAIAQAVERSSPESPLAEIKRQNLELLRTLAALRERQDELVRVNGELEDTNRGVVALFAELDEKADHLRRADEMKTRFLSNMSHEFRTPLNAIRGLTSLLLDRLDGDLTSEQEKQVRLISRATQELSELVDDLLDLAKVEAGKIDVRPIEFDVRNLLAALRGMLRPLWLNSSVALVFDEVGELPPLFTDEGKVSQILRNFISNALKFTERGEVRVSVTLDAVGERILFSVRDTGIGIEPKDYERIFEEFSQVENPLQKRTKGTGLGLPLSKKLAELLGGHIAVASEPGVGSTFTLDIPVRFTAGPEPAAAPVAPSSPDRIPVLAIEDSPETLLLYDRFLQGTPFELLHAATLLRARQVLARQPVRAVLLDILLRGEDSWAFLAEFKSSPATRDTPVIVMTNVDDSRKAFALNADAFAQKPVSRRWLLDTLRRLALGEPPRALIVEDDEAARYLLAHTLGEMGYRVFEAGDGQTGIEVARAERPELVLLDLGLPDDHEQEVFASLTAAAPNRPAVIIMSSRDIGPEEERRFPGAAGILSKSLSRAETRIHLAELLERPMPGGRKAPADRGREGVS
jgi:signal transduction histidine kinase/CheY-like chemotaxis protein